MNLDWCCKESRATEVHPCPQNGPRKKRRSRAQNASERQRKRAALSRRLLVQSWVRRLGDFRWHCKVIEHSGSVEVRREGGSVAAPVCLPEPVGGQPGHDTHSRRERCLEGFTR